MYYVLGESHFEPIIYGEFASLEEAEELLVRLLEDGEEEVWISSDL